MQTHQTDTDLLLNISLDMIDFKLVVSFQVNSDLKSWWWKLSL